MELEHSELIRKLYNRSAKRGAMMLEVVAKQYRFIEIILSPVGKELLADLIEMHDDLLAKIYSDTATELDKAEFRVVKVLIQRWINKINAYQEGMKAIEKEVAAG